MMAEQTRQPYSVLITVAVALSLIAASGVPGGTPHASRVDQQLFEAEALLHGLGYWVLTVDGIADPSTRYSIMAFQKVERLKRTGALTEEVLESLRSASRPEARFKSGRAHVEIDISRQVLFLTDEHDMVVRILPVSTGNEGRYFDQGKWQIAHTPRGAFRIERKVNGIRRAPLGVLYYPNYFYGGVAIHGSLSVPATPASHGCVRIPRYADKAFSDLVSVGMEVFVYD